MAWLERRSLPLPPGQQDAPDVQVALAVRAWNWMGGQVDWAGLPLIADLLGFDDPEMLIVLLTGIRDRMRQEDGR